jgi:hypothetical protein
VSWWQIDLSSFLQRRNLGNNQLAELDIGLFEGLTSLQSL